MDPFPALSQGGTEALTGCWLGTGRPVLWGGDPGTALAQDPPGSSGAGSLRPARPGPHRRAAFSGVTDDTPGTL